MVGDGKRWLGMVGDGRARRNAQGSVHDEICRNLMKSEQ